MEISRVRIKIPEASQDPRVLAFASVQVDDTLAIHDLVLVRLPDGRVLVQFPERPWLVRCVRCRLMIGVTHNYCRHCGAQQVGTPGDRMVEQAIDRTYVSIVHPITQEARRAIQGPVLEAYAGAAARDGAA